jgi:hypothetical protein
VLFKGKDNTTFTVCSVGSMDNTMTLWTSLEKKPFLLMKHFFTQSYLDIAWGSDGTWLMACSHDGKIMYLRFGDSVMPGKRLSRTEQEQLIRPQRQLLSDLPESFDALQTTDSLDTTEDTALVETKTSPLKMGPNQGQGKLVSTPLVRRKQSNPATAVAAMNVINVQKVTVDKKGRKRIAPVAMDSPTQPAATGLHNRLGFPNNATNTQPMFNAVQTMSGFPGATSTERVVEKVATVHQETIVQISSPPLILSPPQTGNMLTCFVPVEDQTPGISHATDEKNTRKRAFSADVRRRGNSDLQGSLAYDKASHFESRVRATLNTELLWTSSLPGKITHVGCTRSFCIAVSRPCAPIPQEQKQPAGSKNKKRRATLEASEGSLLHVFGRLGRRVLPCLVLESLVYSIAVASDDFLLLALCTGEIKVYDLSIPRLVMCANMQGLFATRPRSVSVAKIRLNKGKNNSVQPVVTLSDGNIFAYAEALQGWSLVRDVSLWGSQFNSAWKNDKASSSSQALPRGIELATSSTETSVIDIEQTSIARLAKEAPVPTASWQHSNKLSRTAELAQTLANIECNMYGAELIQSAEEYEYWCVTYVTKLTAQLSTSPTNIELIKAFFEHLFQKGQDLTRAQLEEEDATMDLEDSCVTAVGLLTRLIGKLMAIISKQPSRGMQRLRVRLKESLSVLESYHR